MMTQETLREAVARAICPFCNSQAVSIVSTRFFRGQESYGYCNDCHATGPNRTGRLAAEKAWDTRADMQPEIDRRVAEERAKLFERLRTPSEAACVGLARDIMMWLDMEPKTPRALFKHLERIGREIPQWLRDEPEMRSLDHVPSKATRCAIIWQAMVPAFQQENSDVTTDR